VKVFGIDIWDQTKDAVVSFGQETGITFPLLTLGSQTAQAYGAQKNYIYLIDKNGIIQAISTVPATAVTSSEIDSAAKAIASAIPSLLGAGVAPWKSTPVVSQTASGGISGPARAYDVRGKLIGPGNHRAHQVVFLRNRNVRLPAEKTAVIFGR
jgi:hypothetical protein